MNTLSKLLLIYLILNLLPLSESFSQVGTSFWFVAPEVSQEHGDDPVSFRITAFDQPATVDISMPANGFSDQITIPANSQVNYEGLSNLNLIENRPSNQVLDKGILITSNEDISIYYDVADHHNPDKFTLKADNALGTEFFIPSQKAFDNHNYNNHPAREHIDIVATEDNTEIEIIPTDDVTGHSAGDTIRVTLNRGETYGLVATNDGERANRHLGGTEIQSNNPIAVTISDDSIERPTDPGHWDIIGDQLIPTDLLGTEYIAMHTLYGEAIKTDQKVFILPTEDDTYLAVDGVYKATLAKGELHELTIGNNAVYIQTDKPVYAYQVTGIPPSDNDQATRGTELGSAILPNITCTGSSSVSFTRVLGDRFFIQLMVKESDRGSFSISGPNDSNNAPPTDYLDNPDWEQVPGTGLNGEEAWYSAVIQMGWDNGVGIATGNPYTIENSGLFHMSILDENSVSMSFGYFSDYSTLRINGLTMECLGQTVTLETEDPMLSYYWFSEADPHNHFSENRSVDVTESGQYWVNAEIESGGCFLTDTIDVEFKTPEFTLGNDTVVCPGETVTYDIQATNPGDVFLWSPGGETTRNISVSPNPGEDLDISLTVTDDMGCSSTDDVTVSGYSAPSISWNITGNDVCLGDTIQTTQNMAHYQWTVNGVTNPADTLNYIVADVDGTYELTVWTDHLCSETQRLDLTVHDLPVINLSDEWACPGESGTFTLSGFNSYLWSDGSTSSSMTTNIADSVTVTVTDNYGCSSTDSAYFGIYDQNVFTLPNDTTACENGDLQLQVDAGYSNYQWTFYQDGTGAGQTLGTNINRHSINSAATADEGQYSVTAQDLNGCNVQDDLYLSILDVPDLNIQADDICRGDTIRIQTPDPSFTSFAWTLQSNPNDTISKLRFARVAQAGTYNLKAWQDNSCFADASTTIGFLDAPDFDLTDVTACPNETVTIGVQNWQPANSSVAAPTDYNWSTADPKAPFSTNPTLNNPPEGKYYLTASDGRCTKTDSVEIAYYTLPILELNDTESCDNVDFKLELPSDLASQTASYRWSRDGTSDQGPPNSSWDVSQEADYTLNITDNNGCKISDGFHLTRLSVPNLNIEADDVCEGDTIRIETPNHSFTSFEWTLQSDPGNVISSLRFAHVIQAGTYVLQAWQDNGCNATASTTVGFLNSPDFDLTDVIRCPNDNVSVGVENWTPANGTPSSPVSYEWSSANPRTLYSNQAALDNPPAGKYYLTAFDDRCSSTDSVEIVYHSVPDIQLTDAETCANDPHTLQIPAALQPSASSYHWSRNGTTDQGAPDSNWDVAQTGYYSLNITDHNGCNTSDSLFLNVLNVASLNVHADDICPGDTIVLESDNNAFTEFAWTRQTNPNDTISKAGSIEVTQSGTYVLTAWQDNQCSETTTASINILNTPDFDLTDITACPNEVVSIGLENWQPANGAASGPVSFEWSSGNPQTLISDQPTLENPTAGKYYLTASDTRCTHTDSLIVAYYTLPDIQLTDAEACNNEPYLLELPSALTPLTASYRWSRLGTTDEGPLDSNWNTSLPGDYLLTLTDANGCTSSDSLSLSHISSPVFSLGTDRDKCSGDTIMVETDPFFERYEWNGNSTDNQPNYLLTNTTGTYSLQIWGDNGCSSTEQVDITVNSLPSVDLGPDLEGCAGETVTLSTPSYPEIYWSNGEKNVTSVTCERGKHTVRVVDSNGCSAKDSMNLVWYPVPSVDLGPDLFICPVEYPIDIEAPSGFREYKWHNGQTNRAITANLLDTLNQVTVTDQHGCQGWDTKVVSTFESPSYTLGNDTSACEPEEIILNAGSEIRSRYAGEEQVSFIQSYSWGSGATHQTDTVDQSGTMWVEVFDGCFYLRDTVEVEFFPAPEITALDTSYYAQVSVMAESGTQPYSYALNNENDLQPENTFKDVQNGEHTAYVEDNNGCKALTIFNLDSQYEIEIPDFFTPNNDGFNDFWEIDGLERLPESIVSIFDRYGKLLREFNAAETITWDGEYLNKPVPSDDYWYVIQLKPIDKLIKGHVTIKR